MAKKNAIEPDKFPFPRLTSLLRLNRKVCIVGYPLSSECTVPHYHDIIKGVWSRLTPQSRINPFTSIKDAETVMNWFNWRRRGIRTSQPLQAFQALRQFQQALNLVVATQCVDGLIHINGVENVHALYGNVLHARCHDHAHVFSSWPRPSEGETQISYCPTCGSILFPDVEMFGWNSKAVNRLAFMEQIETAELLITIGVDTTLMPFNEISSPALNALPVIEIRQDGMALKYGTRILTAKNKDIREEIEKATYRQVKVADRGETSFNTTLNYLLQLMKISAGDDDLTS